MRAQTSADTVTAAVRIRYPAKNPMRERRQATISELRQAIDCLPRNTKVAMLNGIRGNQIIVGAYADEGGICPMLAAHRAGGRTSFISFAKAWDRFAFRDTRVKRARRATDRELLILSTHLEASLLEHAGPAPDLAAAVAEHEALVDLRQERARREPRSRGAIRRQAEAKPRPGDADRSRELRNREGWAWTRVVRRYDDYERALRRLDSEQQSLREREREPRARARRRLVLQPLEVWRGAGVSCYTARRSSLARTLGRPSTCASIEVRPERTGPPHGRAGRLCACPALRPSPSPARASR